MVINYSKTYFYELTNLIIKKEKTKIKKKRRKMKTKTPNALVRWYLKIEDWQQKILYT